MANSITLDNTEFQFNESLLPCLITGATGSGVSYFSISIVGNLIQEGKKMIFFTAFPMAKEELYAQIGHNNIFEVKNEWDMENMPKNKSIVVKSGDIHLWQKVIQNINPIEDYIIFVKNIEEYNETVLKMVDKNKKIILSGNIDSCNFKKSAMNMEWQSKIFFTNPKTVFSDMRIPKLEKFESYLYANENLKGILRLQKEEK